jgi:protein TonB
MGRYNPATILRFPAMFWLLLTSTVATSQSIANSNKCFTRPDSLDGHEVFSTVNRQPEYPGGLPQFYKDVVKNLKHPKEKGKGSEKIVFTFIVDTEGHVRNYCFIDPDDGRYDSQIDSLVTHIDNWSPGELYNRKVNVRMLLPMIVEWK